MDRKKKIVMALTAVTGFLMILLLANWNKGVNDADTLKAWTGIEHFPVSLEQMKFTSKGSSFSREISVEFFANPEQIQQWPISTPAMSQAKQTLLPDGTLLFHLVPQGEAAFAEITVSADKRHVKIRTYWS